MVKQSLDEIMAKIEEANNQPETALHQKTPVAIAWADHPEAMLNRKIGALEAERDSARRTASQAREHAGKLESRNRLLESEIAAWKDAASIELVPQTDEPKARFETPDSLALRLQGLYRWATQAEKHGSGASAEVAAMKAKLEADLDTARKALDYQVDQRQKLQDEVAELTAKLNAWKQAASVVLVDDPGEDPSKYETPEALIGRLKSIYGRAKRAESQAKNEVDSHRRTRENLDGWCKRASKAEAELRAVKATDGPLEPNRIAATLHALVSQAAENPQHFHQKAYLFRLAKVAIEALYGGDAPKLKAYETKGSL